MSKLEIERIFRAPPEKVFEYVTQTRHLLKWWGPENMILPEHNLDLANSGSWFSVMENAEGKRFKVSGEVLNVDPPHSV